MTSIGGNVVVDGTVTARQASQPGQAVVLGEDGKVPESMVPAYTLPIGGDAIGGVKNGGNVTINADGTMNAEASGGLTRTIIEFDSMEDFLNKFNSCTNFDIVEFSALNGGDYVIDTNSAFIVLGRNYTTSILSGNAPLYSELNGNYYVVVYIGVNLSRNVINIHYLDPETQSIESGSVTSSDVMDCYGSIVHYQ